MNQELLNMIKNGKIPYRYESDTASALYLALAVVGMVFLYAVAQALTRKFIG